MNLVEHVYPSLAWENPMNLGNAARRRMRVWAARVPFFKKSLDRQRRRSRTGRLGMAFAPCTIVDVGVADGTPALYEAFPSAHLVLVDPLLGDPSPELARLLTGREVECIVAALGARSERRTLHIEEGEISKTSLLRRTSLTRTGNIITTREIEIRTLDEVLLPLELEEPLGLKIDVEGYELEVLQGATTTLGRVEFVIVELSLAQRFHGAPNASGVISWMWALGFELTDILHLATDRQGIVRHMDALFTPASAGSRPDPPIGKSGV